MYRRCLAPFALGFLLVGSALFAQTPHPGLPSTPLWRVQPQEKPAQRQQPKAYGNMATPQVRGLPNRKGATPTPKQTNQVRPKIYRPTRDVRAIK